MEATFWAHGFGKGHPFAHAEGFVPTAVKAQFFHVQLHDRFQNAAAFLDLAPLRLGGRRALIKTPPVDFGQTRADARQMPVGLIGFHPEHIVHDVIGFVHQFNDLPGFAAAVELFHFSQGNHETKGIGHEYPRIWQKFFERAAPGAACFGTSLAEVEICVPRRGRHAACRPKIMGRKSVPAQEAAV